MGRLLLATCVLSVLASSLLGTSAAFAQGAAPEAPVSEAGAPHRLSDPKTGCAAFDFDALPVDSIDWSGTCSGGLISGQGTLSFSGQGKFVKAVIGRFDQGVLRDGTVGLRWADGSHYDGEEAAGHMQGAGTFTTRQGDRLQGQWANGRLNGHGVALWANGDRYEGDWRDGKADGRGIQTWADGRKYDGEWLNDLPNGHGIATRQNGSRYEGYFADGQPKDVSEIAADAVPNQPAVAPAAALAATLPAPDKETAAKSEPPVGALEALAGIKLFAVDDSSLTLTLTEGGLTREIAQPNGATQKASFLFLNSRLGTITEGADDAAIVGVFRLTDTSLAAYYADGRSELLMPNGAGGVVLRSSDDGSNGTGGDFCTNWYPQGHTFPTEERKAALAVYANRLGLAEPGAKTPARPGCAAAANKTAEADTKPAAPAKKTAANKEGANKQALNKQITVPPIQPIEVRASTVHAIDPDPAPALLVPAAPAPDSLIPAAKALGAAQSPANQAAASTDAATDANASTCLSVESDSHHWGFRNRCAFDVQFAYCLMNPSNPLTACRAGAVSGSVAANGFGALIADQGLTQTDAGYNFRWLACAGGAGEVVVHLDQTDPPAGRCIRASAS